MVISFKVPDEIAALAKARGMSVEDYIQELLAQQAAAALFNGNPLRDGQELHAWFAALAQFSEKIPALPETITRDWIYQDHN